MGPAHSSSQAARSPSVRARTRRSPASTVRLGFLTMVRDSGRRLFEGSLSAATEAIGRTQATLRATHLKYHLLTLQLLTPIQVERLAICAATAPQATMPPDTASETDGFERSDNGTYRSSTEGRSGSAFGTRADQVFLGPSVWAATIPVSILIISVRFRSIAVVGRSRRVLWRRVFRSGRIRVLWIGRVVITGRIIISLPCCTARQQ